MQSTETGWIIPLEQLTIDDVGIAGGKNASLGEMIRHLGAAGVRVPGGFAVTSAAYWHVVDDQGLRPAISAVGAGMSDHPESLRSIGSTVRAAFRAARVSEALERDIRAAYDDLCSRIGELDVPVAVRSSATAEDLPEASFAGQQESFLNVRGADAVVAAYHRCVVSLFGDRAIAYRTKNGFDHLDVALSVGIQQMVRSDTGSAGVIFTIDPESGFPHHVLIDAAWGLGEAVVSGVVDSDRYRVFKAFLDDQSSTPIVERSLGRKRLKIINNDGVGGHDDQAGPTATVDTTEDERNRLVLDDPDLLALARWAVIIEDHYGRPMDIEWAKDGVTGDLFIVQARPETVEARRSGATLTTYDVSGHGPVLLKGLSVGAGAATGVGCRLDSPDEGDRFSEGAILVADTTDPDWVPVMQRAAAVVTNRGGRTSHAAIVSRELGVPAVVGAVDATTTLVEGQRVTVSCAGGDVGIVFDGSATIDTRELSLDDVPRTRTKVMVNLANPQAALKWWRLPTAGIGLARMEFIIGEHIGAHPMALAHPDRITDPEVRQAIEELAGHHSSPAEYFVDRLSSGIAALAATWADRPMIVRMSDFKTNEYAGLLGGEQFEPTEANPMLGWRGASRYDHPGYRDGFALECQAVARVRNQIGFDNVIVMIPFCRTPDEADRVLRVMAEIPSNVIRATEFAERFDGFSIGSNDLTQLTLGVDRDSAELATQFGADDPAVLSLIRQLIEAAHAAGKPVGFCGQAPSNDPEYARLLVEAGIDSVSVTPDAFFAVSNRIADAEALLAPKGPAALA